MSAYMQMGHDSSNLVGLEDLEEMQGIILSPVNRTPAELAVDIPLYREKAKYDILLDPQMYLPKSERGVLRDHPYFDSDIDSVLLSDSKWWTKTGKRIVKYAVDLGVDGVISPAIHPKSWSDEYYSLTAGCAAEISRACKDANLRSFATVMIDLDSLESIETALRIGSIVSSAPVDGFYLVIVSAVIPRRELSDAESLLVLLTLVKALSKTGKTVIVSHCSSDMVLFKAAGASHCATGKFFNLRRYTRSRYEEPAQGRGQLAYWFEHGLMAFLRQTDIGRLQKKGLGEMVGCDASNNYWGKKIQEHFANTPAEPWVALGWRQYLSWFGKAEAKLASDDAASVVSDWLKEAEANWRKIDDNGILLAEPRNDGSWVRPWRQALADLE